MLTPAVVEATRSILDLCRLGLALHYHCEQCHAEVAVISEVCMACGHEQYPEALRLYYALGNPHLTTEQRQATGDALVRLCQEAVGE